MTERLGRAETRTNILGELGTVAWNSFLRTAGYIVVSGLIGRTAGSVVSSADTCAQSGASICCLSIDTSRADMTRRGVWRNVKRYFSLVDFWSSLYHRQLYYFFALV